VKAPHQKPLPELKSSLPLLSSADKVTSTPLARALKEKTVEYFDLTPSYNAAISKLIELDSLRNAGLKIAVDSMYGVGSGRFKMFLSGGTTAVTEINSERNPEFPGINPEPIAVNLKKLSSLVVEQKAERRISDRWRCRPYRYCG
jgi:phosphomannomutase